MEAAQSKFEGWAVVEMMGHQREIGFVTTEYFGGAALFRVDSPELPERTLILKRPEYMTIDGDYRLVPAGAEVKRVAVPAKTRMVAPAALYAITPCTEETARKAIEEMERRPFVLLHIPDGQKALPASADESEYEEAEDPEDLEAVL